MANIQDSPKNQSAAPNGGDPTIADIWPTHPLGGGGRADSRCAAALMAATGKIRRLETQLAARDQRIAELEKLAVALERQVEHLDTRLLESETERDEADAETAEHFAALCAEINANVYSFKFFLIVVQFEFEAVAGAQLLEPDFAS
jgi:hypothetical protein